MKPLTLLLLLGASVAGAQGKPTLIDAPLDVKVPLSDAAQQAVQDDFRQLMARSGAVLLPTKTNWKAAVAALKRQDCEVRDECLRQLATTGGTLYALYASVERNAAGTEVTARGRVVNQDGLQVRAPLAVTVARKGDFAALAKDALGQLISQLELGKLSPVLTPAATEPPRAAVEPTPPLPLMLPPPPPPPAAEPLAVRQAPASSGSGLKVAGFVVGGLGLASAAVAGGFGISALMKRGTLPADGRLLDEAQVRAQREVNQGATVALAAGAGAGVALAVAVTLLSLAPSENTQVSLAPVAGGATLVMGGRF